MLPTDSTCRLIINEYNLLVEIQTLCYSAVVYEEDEQINVHFGPPKHRWLPGPRTAAEGGPVCGKERAVKHFNWYKTKNACIFKIG